jgi:hypothetical protein
MIVQVRKGSDPSIYLIAQTDDEEKALQDLVDVLAKHPILTRDSNVMTPTGATNVLLVASKRAPSRRS